jgi:hypothetical protein
MPRPDLTIVANLAHENSRLRQRGKRLAGGREGKGKKEGKDDNGGPTNLSIPVAASHSQFPGPTIRNDEPLHSDWTTKISTTPPIATTKNTKWCPTETSATLTSATRL